MKNDTSITSGAKISEFIEHVYAIAMEPERFEELTQIWNARLLKAAASEFDDFAKTIDHIEDHFFRADAILASFATGGSLLPVSLRMHLESDNHASIALDAKGEIKGLNDAATASFRVSEGDSIAALGLSDKDAALLLRQIQLVCEGDGTPNAPVLLRLSFESGDRLLLLSLTPMATSSARKLALLKSAEFLWPKGLGPFMQKAFSLTEAEADITRRLCQGQSIQDIAIERRASTKTVRTQLTSIYEKTETKSQTELVRMAMVLTRLSTPKADVKGDPSKPMVAAPFTLPYPRDDHRRIVTLPDGRRFEFADFGDPSGTPVIHFHCEFFGDGWMARMAEKAAQQGLRIISPVRPGSGRSSVLPEGLHGPKAQAQDLVFLLDQLEVDKAIHISQMAGTQFSLQAIADNPERLLGKLIVAQTFPFDAGIPGVSPPYFQKILASAISSHPMVLKYLTRTGMAYFNRVGPKRFFQTFGKDSPTDMAALENEDILGAMSHGAALCSAQGHLGYFSDYRNIIDDPMQKLLDIEAPVRVLIGGQAKPEEAGNLRHAIAQKPNFEERFLADAGTYMFFTHWKDVLSALAELKES